MNKVMDYKTFLNQKIHSQNQLNKNFPIKVWEYVSQGGVYTKTKKENQPDWYESIEKRLKKGSKERNISQVEYAKQLLELKGLGLDQTLELWAIKPERQNLNESWKKEYIESLKPNTYRVNILRKVGPDSLYLNEDFNIVPKPKSKRGCQDSSNLNTFDFLISGFIFNTAGFDGTLVVDKTTKVQGGSQKNVQDKIKDTVDILGQDPMKRVFIVLLDGDFWKKFIKDYRDKYPTVFVMTSEELMCYVQKNESISNIHYSQRSPL
jgi:hypothetical protein